MPPINFKMKIAICDDDEKDRSEMRRMTAEYMDLHNYHVRIDDFPTGEAFLERELSEYDLVIMDIFMGRLNGIETAKAILEKNPNTQIIFCSSSNAYAAESYDVSALRYFLKPVAREKLFATLDRYFHIHTTMRTLVFKRNRMEEYVYLTDILWIEADGHRCVIHTRSGEITTRTSFTQLCDQLRDADFIRPIRYALVSLAVVATVPSDVLTLTDGTTVPISRELRQEMRQAFTAYKMKLLMKKGGALV